MTSASFVSESAARTENLASAGRDVVEPSDVELSLLGSFDLTIRGTRVAMAQSCQRLVALLAVVGQPVRRVYVAGSLWPDKSDGRAAANLRSTIWRLGGSDVVVEAPVSALALHPDVSVDLPRVTKLARILVQALDNDALTDRLLLNSQRSLEQDLLPDWYDDWLVIERERLRQLRLYALEALSRLQLGHGCPSAAIEAALTATRIEPLRESAHRLLIEIHLSEGNWSEAIRQYDRCCALLRSELGVGPSAQLRSLFRTGHATGT
jgi:DNA-binding SARP family transcriptional activator